MKWIQKRLPKYYHKNASRYDIIAISRIFRDAIQNIGDENIHNSVKRKNILPHDITVKNYSLYSCLSAAASISNLAVSLPYQESKW